MKETKLGKMVFAGGCFWCTEAVFNPLFGVVSATSGYFGGKTGNPTYEQVSNHETDHREAVEVLYEDTTENIKRLLVNYFKDIDPTQEDGQFHDVGYQYTTAIYYLREVERDLAQEAKRVLEESLKFGSRKIAVQILDGRGLVFYKAEDYHQKYSENNKLKYDLYKKGSGRADFIKNNWIQDHTFDKFLNS